MRDDLGLQGGWAVDEGGNTAFPFSVRSALPLMRQAGATWVRINFRLGGGYRSWTGLGAGGRTALAAYDEVVAAAEAEGLQVLGLLSNETWHGGQAEWSAGSAEAAGGDGENAYLRAFVEAAATLGRHFAGRVAAWEVWNEPDAWTQAPGPGRYQGGTFMYPSNFAWLLARAYAALRTAAGDGVQVISGGLFGHDIGGSRTTGAGYLRATYEAGRRLAGWEAMRERYGSYPLDGVGYHLYVDQGGPASARTLSAYLDDVRRASAAYEGRAEAKAMHVTEFSWPSDGVGEALQAQNLETAYEAFRRAGDVARGYWGAVYDIPGAPPYAGLVRGDGSPKPAFEAYRRLAG
jgi:hypothetical protein